MGFRLAERMGAEGMIEGCKQAGIALHTWTVNRKEDLAVLIAADVDAVITNFPDLAVKLRGKNDSSVTLGCIRYFSVIY